VWSCRSVIDKWERIVGKDRQGPSGPQKGMQKRGKKYLLAYAKAKGETEDHLNTLIKKLKGGDVWKYWGEKGK